MEKQLIMDTFDSLRDRYLGIISGAYKPEQGISVTAQQWASGVMKLLVAEYGIECFREEYKRKNEHEALEDTLNSCIGALLPQIKPRACAKWDREDAAQQKRENDYVARKDVFNKNFIRIKS